MATAAEGRTGQRRSGQPGGQGLATVYLDRKTQEAVPAHRLLPLLAGLAEIEPWLHQWHTDEQPAVMGSPTAFFIASTASWRSSAPTGRH
ncbi:hypothetical protein [Micromonospora sp. NPDC049799]|uniref:DUF7008 domain-containing protein n=1 Tax=Micromonospora sp. NPDC049799 TaxID=3154741 RepID=UPI0033F66A51